MNFLSPAFLVGLPLVAVPLVIHLLSRRQQKKISWGAMRFLLQAATRKRRLWRLTDILLLLLRTAAFLFFIFALARPLLPATWLGGSIPREVILVLDQSMSMARRADGTTLFELQLQKAGELLDELNASDSVRVLLAGESPEWLTPTSIAGHGSSLRTLRSQLNALRPSLAAADLVACIREAADLEPAKDKSGRLIVVLTDGQRFGWRMDERPLWAALQARLDKAELPTGVNVELLDRPGADSGNLCVNRIETARAFGAVDQSLNFSALIQNHGSKPSAPTLLSWRVDEQSIGVATVPELAPEASTRLSLSHPFPAAGTFDVRCALEARDSLVADNEAHLLVQVFDRVPVLFVEARAAKEPLQTDAAFVLAALGARQPGAAGPAWRSVFEPTIVEPGALASTELGRFRCVVLADVPRLDAAVVEKLDEYVRGGGGVWITLGDDTDEAAFNEQFHSGGLGLSPLKIKGAIGDANDREKFVAIRATSDTHPATALLADFQRLDLDRARVYRRQQFDPFSGKDVSVLLQSDQGDAVVVERKLGQGRVLVQAIPLGVSWSTLPLCQAYVALLHEWLWYLAEPSLPKRNLAVGESLIERASSAEASAELTLPDARTVRLAAGAAANGAHFRYSTTRWPGQYTLRDGEGRTALSAKFNVARNPDESNLAPLSEADLEQLRAAKHFQLGGPLASHAATPQWQVPKHPLEGQLLAALAFALLGELMLAGWMTHRRNRRVQAVTMG